MGSSKTKSEAGETAFFFVFIPSIVSFRVNIYVQLFFVAVRNQTSNIKYLLEFIREGNKVMQRICYVKVL